MCSMLESSYSRVVPEGILAVLVLTLGINPIFLQQHLHYGDVPIRSRPPEGCPTIDVPC